MIFLYIKIFIIVLFMKFNFLSAQANNPAKNIYDFVVEDINGENFYFNKLKGKKIMIVNTASKLSLIHI